MTKEVIEAYELFEGVQTFSTLWEWSERFVRNGFRIATAADEIGKAPHKLSHTDADAVEVKQAFEEHRACEHTAKQNEPHHGPALLHEVEEHGSV